MAQEPYFGFDLQQRKTLMRLLEGLSPEAVQDLQDQLDALEARVADLETP